MDEAAVETASRSSGRGPERETRAPGVDAASRRQGCSESTHGDHVSVEYHSIAETFQSKLRVGPYPSFPAAYLAIFCFVRTAAVRSVRRAGRRAGRRTSVG